MRIAPSLTAALLLLPVLAACSGPASSDRPADTATDAATDPAPDAGAPWTVTSTRACGQFEGTNRIHIDREYGPEPRCLRLGLVDPGAAPAPGLDLPAGWSLDFATLHRTTCVAASGSPGQQASAATGRISLDQGTLWTVSLQTGFEFPAEGALPGETVRLDAEAVPLAGSCP